MSRERLLLSQHPSQPTLSLSPGGILIVFALIVAKHVLFVFGAWSSELRFGGWGSGFSVWCWKFGVWSVGLRG